MTANAEERVNTGTRHTHTHTHELWIFLLDKNPVSFLICLSICRSVNWSGHFTLSLSFCLCVCMWAHASVWAGTCDGMMTESEKEKFGLCLTYVSKLYTDYSRCLICRLPFPPSEEEICLDFFSLFLWGSSYYRSDIIFILVSWSHHLTSRSRLVLVRA